MEDQIESYFLQATCYAMMAEERLGLVIPQIAILIAVGHEEPQVFVKLKLEYISKVRELFA